ncbi:MAG: PepSY domain-containing protein [Bdellovibrionales bacterium]|nr:PepSY domain-containing protein [Bdellovibrionales bacterium]
MFWTTTGLFMSFVPIEKVRSEHLVKKSEPMILKSFSSYLPIEKIVQKTSLHSPVEVKLVGLLQNYVYVIKQKEKTDLFDAFTGEQISPISKDLAIEIAISHFMETAEIKNVGLVSTPITEYKGKLPVWKIDFNNDENTTFYISSESGELLGRRSSLWRIYDFMWMFHIMDYKERENFSHWWLILSAFLAVFMSVSGVWLIFYSFRKRDFKFFRSRLR